MPDQQPCLVIDHLRDDLAGGPSVEILLDHPGDIAQYRPPVQNPGELALIDEVEARKEASRLGIPYLGSLRVLRERRGASSTRRRRSCGC